jgi:hypothetical protein
MPGKRQEHRVGGEGRVGDAASERFLRLAGGLFQLGTVYGRRIPNSTLLQEPLASADYACAFSECHTCCDFHVGGGHPSKEVASPRGSAPGPASCIPPQAATWRVDSSRRWGRGRPIDIGSRDFVMGSEAQVGVVS